MNQNSILINSSTASASIETDKQKLRVLLFEGALKEIERYMQTFCDRPRDFIDSVDLRAELFSQVDRKKQKLVEAGILIITLKRIRRTACVSTQPSSIKTIVFGATQKNGMAVVDLIPEDPALLVKQAGRLLSLPSDLGPPPIS
jgi:23S rRNA A1618 N6-methylase RlmF